MWLQTKQNARCSGNAHMQDTRRQLGIIVFSTLLTLTTGQYVLGAYRVRSKTWIHKKEGIVVYTILHNAKSRTLYSWSAQPKCTYSNQTRHTGATLLADWADTRGRWTGCSRGSSHRCPNRRRPSRSWCRRYSATVPMSSHEILTRRCNPAG